MEIEVKIKIGVNHVQNMFQYVVSAVDHQVGVDRRDEFLKVAQRAFLDDVQRLVEISFNKGREYERRNGKDAQ